MQFYSSLESKSNSKGEQGAGFGRSSRKEASGPRGAVHLSSSGADGPTDGPLSFERCRSELRLSGLAGPVLDQAEVITEALVLVVVPYNRSGGSCVSVSSIPCDQAS